MKWHRAQFVIYFARILNHACSFLEVMINVPNVCLYLQRDNVGNGGEKKKKKMNSIKNIITINLSTSNFTLNKKCKRNLIPSLWNIHYRYLLHVARYIRFFLLRRAININSPFRPIEQDSLNILRVMLSRKLTQI